jgi:hypothetical protein
VNRADEAHGEIAKGCEELVFQSNGERRRVVTVRGGLCRRRHREGTHGDSTQRDQVGNPGKSRIH